MNIQRTYSIENKIVEAFEKKVNSGERSEVIEELIKDYLVKNFPDTTSVRMEREFEMKKAQERLEELMSISKVEADKAQAEQNRKEQELLYQKKSEARQHFLDDCRKRAKILANVEFGLDPLTEFLPKSFLETQRFEYMARWKTLTEDLVSKGEERIFDY